MVDVASGTPIRGVECEVMNRHEVAVGLPVGVGVVVPPPQPLASATGLFRWRCFWLLACLLNGGTCVLVWILNMCAPLTLEWLELAGPVLGFRLAPDELAIYCTEQCCSAPLPCCGMVQVDSIRPAEIEAVDVYAEVVSLSVMLVGGGTCCSSPIVLQTVDDIASPTEEDGNDVRALPDCSQCATQPCMLWCGSAVRDETSYVTDVTRCFLGCKVVENDGSSRTVRLSRNAFRLATVGALFASRDVLRERLHRPVHAIGSAIQSL